MKREIKVLIVDDSALTRRILRDGLDRDPLIEVVGTACDAFSAREKIVELRPDVITLDLDMPKINGMDFLKRLMQHYPIPTVMVSANSSPGISQKAISYGAAAFVEKPQVNGHEGVVMMLAELSAKIRSAFSCDLIKNKRIRLLIVDDSAIARKILREGLQRDPLIDVIGTAASALIARDKILDLRPDVITLDMIMPEMNGLEFLKVLTPLCPTPAIMVSTQNNSAVTIEALSSGAVDFVVKPDSSDKGALAAMLAELSTKIRAAATVSTSRTKRTKVSPLSPVVQNISKKSRCEVIAIGASTGGTKALRTVLKSMPVNSPGIVVAQHMPPVFTNRFALSLDSDCVMKVKEAEQGDEIKEGIVFIAPGDRHLSIVRSNGVLKVHLDEKPKVNGHRPSVDVLFDSVVKCVGNKCVAALLTGMGKDGAEGMLRMHEGGIKTIAQDQESCVIYGMPKVAVELGAVDYELHLDEISGQIIRLL